MTDRDKIRTEVKRRIAINTQCIGHSFDHTDERIDELEGILSFIDSMQEESTITIVKTTDGNLWNGNMREEPVNITVGEHKEATGVLKELIDEADAKGWQEPVSNDLEEEIERY